MDNRARIKRVHGFGMQPATKQHIALASCAHQEIMEELDVEKNAYADVTIFTCVAASAAGAGRGRGCGSGAEDLGTCLFREQLIAQA